MIFLGVQSLRQNLNATGQVETPLSSRRKWWAQGMLHNLLNTTGPLFYLGVFAVFVHPESSTVELLLLVLTMMGVSTGFWVLFVYVLQVSSVRGHLLDAGQWVTRLLGAVLIALGVRLWLTGVPDQA